jgi:hypothetical protein
METDMRKVWQVLLAAPLLFSAALMPVAAEAMPGPVRVAGPSSLFDRVYCRRIWGCENWGCGWHDACWRNGEDWRRQRGSNEDWRWMRWQRP